MTQTIIAVVLGLVSLCHVSNAVVPPVTGKYYTTIRGQCDIKIRSFGWVDINNYKQAYIKVNGLTYMDSFDGNFAYRGFNLVYLDTNTCRASNYASFDTNFLGYAPGPSDALTAYINNIPDGTHVLGTISDDAFYAMRDNAKAALKSLGVDVYPRVYGDKVIFHAIKGEPEKAIVRTSPARGEALYYEETAPTCAKLSEWLTAAADQCSDYFSYGRK